MQQLNLALEYSQLANPSQVIADLTQPLFMPSLPQNLVRRPECSPNTCLVANKNLLADPHWIAPQVVSLEGFTAGVASDWRRKTGLVGSRTWGEKELRELTPPQATAAC